MELIFDQKKLEKVAKKFRLKFVILHGSYAIGNPHDHSDLDIAVVAKKELNFRKQMDLHGAMSEIFGDSAKRELDFKTLNRVDPFFRYEVTRAGKLLYGDQTTYEEFKAFSLRAFEDAKPLFELEKILSKKYQDHLNALSYAK